MGRSVSLLQGQGTPPLSEHSEAQVGPVSCCCVAGDGEACGVGVGASRPGAVRTHARVPIKVLALLGSSRCSQSMRV